MAQDARLQRIEDKLDKLADAVVSMARMEERMITLFKRMDSYDSAAAKDRDRIAALERVSYGRGFFFRNVDRFVWVVIGTGIGLVLKAYGG